MIQLQSVLMPNEEICNISELYFHKQEERVDFDGYFNLFYVEKRKKYTMIDNLNLSIILKGYVSLTMFHNRRKLQTIALVADTETHYLVEFPYVEVDDGVFWFSLIEDGEISEKICQGFFSSNLSADKCRAVNIGIDICTFKREIYVERNLRQLKDKLLNNRELDVSAHLKIYIIDNGQTLHEQAGVQAIISEAKGSIFLYKNMNAGGAGGFTRGMLEIMHDKDRYGLSHVLLMDDDAIIEPDTLVRLYGLLATLNEEWKDMSVGGAMLREDRPYALFCFGEQWENGVIINSKRNIDLRDYNQASSESLTGVGCEHDEYSGWWCCCYSLNTVREDNLPIPLFIHHDDIEFGLRNRDKGITFLNGIGVWHCVPESRFPGSNIYYDTRNNLIELALNGSGNKCKVAKRLLFRAITLAVIRLRYKDMHLAYQGLVDFLKGPEWLHKQNPEALNTAVRKQAYSLKPLAELETELTKEESGEVKKQIAEYLTQSKGRVFNDNRKKATWMHYLTFNGWFLPSDHTHIKIIVSLDSPYEVFRKKKIMLYEPEMERAVIISRNFKELRTAFDMYRKANKVINHSFEQAVTAYQNDICEITNKEAWSKFLNLN